MGLERIGILSIGEMGYHWARVLRAHGAGVLSCAGDRSEGTRRRAESAGVRLVPSLDILVSQVDLVVSIVIPFAAVQVAQGVARAISRTGKTGLIYMDANAISPMTAEAVGHVLTRAKTDYVDGCIIGSAAKMDQGTVVYVSGPHAQSLCALNELGLCVKVLGPGATQASAFKVLHAGLTKGLAGLFIELLVGAERLGLLDETLADYERTYPGLLQKVGQSTLSLPLHAARRSEEMAELSDTLRHFGLNPIVLPSVGKVLRAIADLKFGEFSPASTSAKEPVELIKLFSKLGLLRRVPAPKRAGRKKSMAAVKKGRVKNSRQ